MKTIRSQIMDFVETHGPCTRTSILKFLIPLLKGRPYDWHTDRGWYSTGFQERTRAYYGMPTKWMYKEGFLMKPSKRDPRYLKKNKHHVYSVVK